MRGLAIVVTLLLAGCARDVWLAERVIHRDPTMIEPVAGVSGFGRPFYVYDAEPETVTTTDIDGRVIVVRNPAPLYVYDAEPVYAPETATTRGLALVPANAPDYVFGGDAIEIPADGGPEWLAPRG